MLVRYFEAVSMVLAKMGVSVEQLTNPSEATGHPVQ